MNVQPLQNHNKLENLEALVYRLEPPSNIICITETWFNDNTNIDPYLLTGYNGAAVKNRENRKVGGVMIQTRTGTNIKRILESVF